MPTKRSPNSACFSRKNTAKPNDSYLVYSPSCLFTVLDAKPHTRTSEFLDIVFSFGCFLDSEKKTSNKVMKMKEEECAICHDLGVAIREDKNHDYKLFEWPCPNDCATVVSAIISMHKQPRNKKMR